MQRFRLMCIKAKHLSLVCPDGIAQKSCVLFRFSFANLSCTEVYCIVLYRKNKFSSGNPSKVAILVQAFSSCTVMNMSPANQGSEVFCVSEHCPVGPWDSFLG